MEHQLRPYEPFIFGTHPCASVGIVREISTILQTPAAFGCGIESTEIPNVSITSSTTDAPEDHRQEFVSFSSTKQSAQDFDSEENNDEGFDYSSQNRDSEMNGPVTETVGDAVEPEQADSSCVKRSSSKSIGMEQIAYEPNTKENNREMNEDEISSGKKGGEPMSPAPLLTRLDRLDVVLAYLEEKSLSSGHSTPHPNTNGESTKPTPENSSSTRIMEKRCKPMSSVLIETVAKGNIVDRVASLENKVSKLSEDLERMIPSSRSSSLGRDAINVNMKEGSNTATGLNIFEEEKHQVLPLEEECFRKGVHENISMPRPPHLQLDISKSNISPHGEKNDENVLADRKNISENLQKGVMDGESETKANKKIASKNATTATGVNTKNRFSKDENKSPTKSGTGKLRHLLPGCIFSHSPKA